MDAFADAAIAAGMLPEPQDGDSKRLAFSDWVADVTGASWAGDETPAQARPQDRIAVDVGAMTISLDGTKFDVPSEMALRWVKVLSLNPGYWWSAKWLSKLDPVLTNVRTDKLRRHLPVEIKGLIDAQRGVGSRIRL